MYGYRSVSKKTLGDLALWMDSTLMCLQLANATKWKRCSVESSIMYGHIYLGKLSTGITDREIALLGEWMNNLGIPMMEEMAVSGFPSSEWFIEQGRRMVRNIRRTSASHLLCDERDAA